MSEIYETAYVVISGLAQEKALPKLDVYLTDFQALDIKQTEI